MKSIYEVQSLLESNGFKVENDSGVLRVWGKRGRHWFFVFAWGRFFEVTTHHPTNWACTIPQDAIINDFGELQKLVPYIREV